MKRYLLLFILLSSICFPSYSQSTHIISGVIKDINTNDVVIGAKVQIKELPNRVTIAMGDGKYSFKVSPGNYTIIVSALGFETTEKSISVSSNDVLLDFKLKEHISTSKTVEITIEKDETENVESTDVGKVQLEMKQVKLLPAVFGEVDVMKTLQLLPGVQSAGEGQSGLYIRGGGPDQNLVLLDDAPILNTGHLFGFFSVFNSDAIEDVSLYKGGMPARYGGRLSSVVDFSMPSSIPDKWSANGGIGLIASRLTIQGPIQKGKTSLMLSGRRTYIDILSKPFLKDTESGGIPYYFYDMNGKLIHKFSDKDNISLSGYIGRDVVSLNLLDGRFKADFDWGNAATTLKWNHIFNSKWKSSLSFIYNTYSFDAVADFDNFRNTFLSKIQDYTSKYNLTFYPNSKGTLNMGIDYTYHKFIPRTSETNTTDDDGINFTSGVLNPDKRAHEMGVYLSYDYDISKKFRVNTGLRYSYFIQVGPYNLIQQNGDTLHFASNKKVVSYDGVEPRVSMRYKIDSNSSVKASATYVNQYMHLISLSGNALPFDVWVPSSSVVKPQRGFQYAGGYYRNFLENKLGASVEVFYRNMKNQIEYREDYVPTNTGDLENDLVFGNGQAYGIELLLKKSTGNFQGWIGYTLSKTSREFKDINNGEEFPYRYDRRHDLSIVGSYKLNDRWSFGGTFVYGTGQAITIQQNRYVISGNVINEYGPRNGFRLPAFHRLDISATLKNKPDKKYESSWTFAIYNAYNRANPYIIYVDTEGDVQSGELDVQAKMLYIFPILPSVTWNFKF